MTGKDDEDSQIEAIKDLVSSESGDTYSYRGWLISDKFHKRILAVFGYSILGTLALYALIIIVFGVYGWILRI